MLNGNTIKLKMREMKKIKYFIILLFLPLMFSCVSKPEIKVDIISNRNIQLDYANSYNDGFKISNKLVLNTLGLKGKYFKIYYQNESYKFDDNSLLSNENFYGSWLNTDIEFKKIAHDTVTIKFNIAGNPRNENKFFHYNRVYFYKDSINDFMNYIDSQSEWKKQIEQKAIDNNIDYKTQLYNDAKWIITDNQKKRKINNRWQRNLRVGRYSLLIVIVDSSKLKEIPDYIRNISLKNAEGNYVNPYKYFASHNGVGKIIKLDSFITVKAKPPIIKGVYVNKELENIDTSNFNKYVNNSIYMEKNAAFEYYPNKRASKDPILNTPVKCNILSKGYTIEEYNKNKLIGNDKRKKIFFTNSNSQGKTFGVNENDSTLWFKNPANKEGEYKKENVGIITRNGFTYGKFTYKVKMSEMLNKDNVWTGLTNALWLITENSLDWNTRRKCNKGGYMPYYGAPKTEKRVPVITYSEIDFEIIKTAENWPLTSYKNKKDRKPDPASHKDKVMVACTNFDLACQEPDSVFKGAKKIIYKTDTFWANRWDEYYHALTSKKPIADDELFAGEYYYFQIEWKPTEIIWRIGKDKNNLKVVGYMNDKITNIPNNQMLCVVTQEFHFSHWWPDSPFEQENIPFSTEDLKGVLYSLEIE